MTKIQLRNLNQTSAAKYWPNFSSKIPPELQLQNLDQTLCWKSEQKFSFMTEPQPPNLQQAVANAILSININNSNNLNKFELAPSHARVTSIKPTVSQSVGEWQA